MEVKLKKLNKNRLRIISDSQELLNFVRKHFTVKNPTYRFQPFGQKHLSCISPTNTCHHGLALDIIQRVRAFDRTTSVDVSEVKDLIMPFSFKVNTSDLLQPINKEYKYRDYQADAIIRGLRSGRGTFEMATNAGKSLIIYGLIQNYWHQQGNRSKILILVPNIQLVAQMKKDLIDYGMDESVICTFSAKFSREIDPKSDIIISNRQWLEGHANELPTNIDIAMVDEVHGLSTGNEVSKFVSGLKTQKRFGFTGSMPDWGPNHWNIIGLCGRILKVKRPKELQDEGYAAPTKIVAIRFRHPSQPQPPDDVTDPLERAKMMYPLEWHHIEECDFSNNYIVKVMNGFANNTMVLYDHVDHGYRLKELLLESGTDREVFLIDGSTPLDYREEVRARMEQSNNCFLFGNTKCVGTGINIKNIHNIGFAFSSGRAATKIVQAIGRGLRTNENKQRLLLVDFYHSLKYSSEHFKDRIALYEANYNYDEIHYKYVDVK